MARSAPVDGFVLAYDRFGTGEPVVLLHGWPGDRTDFRALGPALALGSACEVIVPDLRGFGESDKHAVDPADQYSPSAQARSVAGLIRELGLNRVLLAGYDVGSRVAQAVAAEDPDLVRALVVSPPLPGIGRRVLEPQPQREFWYQSFHQLPLAEQAPAPGDRLALPVTVLWPEFDPLFPRAWSDRVGEFFSDITVRPVDGAGHFTPLEAPAEFAEAIHDALVATRTVRDD